LTLHYAEPRRARMYLFGGQHILVNWFPDGADKPLQNAQTRVPVPVQGTSHAILASSWPELKISQPGCDSSPGKREGSFPGSSDKAN
jgi:hypothetical protein